MGADRDEGVPFTHGSEGGFSEDVTFKLDLGEEVTAMTSIWLRVS